MIEAHPRAAEIVAAVRACTQTRFRPQGRTPGLGLDCVGVVLIAARAAGIADPRVPAYALGGAHEAGLAGLLAANGCTAIDRAMPGDVLIAAPAEGRLHLAVVVPGGIVHAHAGLGRVVEGPLDPAWRIAAAYRLPESC